MDKYGRGHWYQHGTNVIIELADDYDHNDDNIEYVPENVLQRSNRETSSFGELQQKFNIFYSKYCECKSNECNRVTDCFHGGNYVEVFMPSTGCSELVLNKTRLSRDLLYECSQYCTCPSDCLNRLVQFGPRRNLCISDFSHLHKQFGLITTKPIPEGGFVCEYAGELLTKEEAVRRQQENDVENRMNYIICLNEHSEAANDDDLNCLQTFIDPSQVGNIGRYLNHSCEPNCEILSVRIDGPIPKLGKYELSFSQCHNNFLESCRNIRDKGH